METSDRYEVKVHTEDELRPQYGVWISDDERWFTHTTKAKHTDEAYRSASKHVVEGLVRRLNSYYAMYH
jgi:hypothetical protein